MRAMSKTKITGLKKCGGSPYDFFGCSELPASAINLWRTKFQSEHFTDL
jgi:hypothetical protein